MKKLLFTLALAFTANLSFGQTTVYVKGYTTNNGTYVQPHYRTSPNFTVYDNWSTAPNINPYTGTYGTKVYNYEPTISSPSYQNNNLFRTNDLFKPNSLFH
jgi:hypothetical protein